MRVDFGKTFSFAFKYAFNLKRILPFFIINLLLVAFAFVFIDYAIDLLPILLSGSFTSIPVTTLIYAALVIFVVVAVTSLLKIYFQAVITDNAGSYWQKKKKALSKSLPSGRTYLTVLIALILAGLITSIVTSVLDFVAVLGRFLAVICSIVLGLIFLFLIQIIVISKRGIVDSIKAGYALFMKNKFDVFIFWLVLTILSFILLLVAIIPIGIVLIPIITPFISAMSTSTGFSSLLGNITALIQANMLSLAVAGIVSSFIIAYLSVFQESAKTFFYMQKKRR
jgi:hypothetical protein